ncbi:MAG: hypothetical protein HZB50_17795 [Chloroflexi bacterium]|nr:hypothetical protein [Chloroflexota bacterium]
MKKQDFLWIIPLSLILGAVLSVLQTGNWLMGWLGFSFLFIITISLLTLSTKWAGGGKTLAWMIALAFILRFAGGVTTYLALPVYGYVDEDQSAGYTYTDAHRRDAQAWELATSEDSIFNAFSKTYASDQYGGLLAFSAFIYRYVSPDSHRTLMLVLLSAFMSALALPFFWKAVNQEWGERLASTSGWIYALYPESILIGGSALREPYLWAFSAFVLWGFVSLYSTRGFDTPLEGHSGLLNHRQSILWLGLGIAGMLLISPGVAVATLIILAGWVYFTRGQRQISWRMVFVFAVVLILGLFLLSFALNRNGNLGNGNPLDVLNNFIREVASWGGLQLKRSSGMVDAVFKKIPDWMQLPFVTIYGIFQPVLPAAFAEPTLLIWRIIQVLRAMGWYALLPALALSFLASTSEGEKKKRAVFIWLSLFMFIWILFTALRGGGDQWDNPRYRAIMILWQAILAGNVWIWWRETKNTWVPRVLAMELVFLIFFGQWYASRYFSIGVQLPFTRMVAIILGLWAVILVWRFKK